MKKMILVTSPPACGKTFVTKKLAKAMPNCVYLDKDSLIVLSKQIFAKGAGITTFAKRDDRFHFEQDMADVVIDDLLQIIRFFKI